MTTLFMQLADLPIQVSKESLREIERVVELYYCIDKGYSLEVHDHKQLCFSTQDEQPIKQVMYGQHVYNESLNFPVPQIGDGQMISPSGSLYGPICGRHRRHAMI